MVSAKVVNLRKNETVIERPIPYVPTRPKVTHALEKGEPYVFVIHGNQSVGVPSNIARLIARDIIASAAEAEGEARAKKASWKP
jgi:hypothetical protein